MVAMLNDLGRMWWSWAAPIAWQVALLALVVWVIDLALQRHGWPQVRYALWLLVFVRLFIPPDFALPTSLTARALSSAEPMAARAALDTPHQKTIDRAQPPAAASADPSAHPPSPPEDEDVLTQPTISWQAWAMLSSAMVSSLLVGWLLIRARRLRCLIREGVVCNDGSALIHGLMRECAAHLRLRRLPTVILTEQARGPAVFGLFRPVLLLPQFFGRGFSREQASYVLLHELAHIKRGDLIANAVQTLVHVLFWFHPAVWLAGRRLRHVRELCCDATVSRLLRERTSEYRTTLIETARWLVMGRGDEGLRLLGLFESPSRIRQRLKYLERPAWRYARLKLMVSVAAVTLMLACVVPMARWTYGAEAPPNAPVAAAPTVGPVKPAGSAVLSGTVVRADDRAPVAGVSVELWGSHMACLASVQADSQGRFEIRTEATGEVMLIARDDAWFSKFDQSVFRPVRLNRGDVLKDLVVDLIPAGGFNGTVVDKETGQPLAGVSVVARSGVIETTTAKDGAFHLGGLPPGLEIPFRITAPGYGIDILILTPVSGEPVTRRIELGQEGIITGKVLDEKGQPIVGAAVGCRTGHYGSDEYYNTNTNKDGRYTLRRINRGEAYDVSASKDGYTNEGQIPGRTVIPLNETEVTVDFTLKPVAGVTVCGKVIDQDGNPIAGAKVYWGRYARGPQVVTTDVDSSFVFPKLDAKFPEDVYAVKPGYGVEKKKVDPRDPAAGNVVITLRPELIIRGRVIDEQGKPVPDATIQIGAECGAFVTGTTDSAGNFTLRQLAEGSYPVTAIAIGFVADEQNVVKAGTTRARIDVRHTAELTGRVVDLETGQPVTTFNVRLAWPRIGKGLGGISVDDMEKGVEFQSTEGRFSIGPRDPLSTYRLIVTAPGYQVGELDGAMTGAPAEVRLLKARPVTVRVADAANGKTIPNAQVRFWYYNRAEPLDNNCRTKANLPKVSFPPFSPNAARDGRYEFSAVGSGPWVLEVIAQGFVRYTQAFPDGVGKDTVDVALIRGVTVSGLLRTSENLLPAQFMIELRDEAGEWAQARPDRDGRFQFPGIPPGPAALSFRYGDDGTSCTRPVTVQSASANQWVINLGDLPVVDGRVTRDDQPVAQADIGGNDKQGNSAYAKSDAEGRYRLWLPAQGSYQVECYSKIGKRLAKIDAKPGLQTLDLRLTGRSISGIVLDSNGQPLPDGSVNCSMKRYGPEESFIRRWLDLGDWTSGGWASIGRDGAFVVSCLDPGVYKLYASSRDRNQFAVSEAIDLTAQADITGVRLSMDGTGGLDLTAVDRVTGQQVEQVSARFADLTLNSRETKARGLEPLRLSDVPAGFYDVIVSAKGYRASRLKAVEVKPAERRPLRVALDRGGELSLTMKCSVPPKKQPLPHPAILMLVVLKNLTPGSTDYYQPWSGLVANAGFILLESDLENLKGELDGLASGDYEATLYYLPQQGSNPASQGAVRFHIEVGKTTEVALKEAELQPFKDVGASPERH